MLGLLCRLICAFFGMGFMFGARRARWGWGRRRWGDEGSGCEGAAGHHHHGGGMLGADPEKRRRFRRRLREALDELLADEPTQPAEAQGQPPA